MTDNSKFSFKWLGATMEAMNLKPDSFIKIFWHIALIIAFLKLVGFLCQLGKAYFGIA